MAYNILRHARWLVPPTGALPVLYEVKDTYNLPLVNLLYIQHHRRHPPHTTHSNTDYRNGNKVLGYS